MCLLVLQACILTFAVIPGRNRGGPRRTLRDRRPLVDRVLGCGTPSSSIGPRAGRGSTSDLPQLCTGLASHGRSAGRPKAAAVEKLYGTSVYHLGVAALRIGEALEGVDIESAGPELVEDMAVVTLPDGKVIRYRSFASKFAHFFVDHDRFPIHDSFAAKMLRAHLGSGAPAVDSGATYMRIEGAFRRLAWQVGLGSDTRQLDRYLWMIGRIGTGLRIPVCPSTPSFDLCSRPIHLNSRWRPEVGTVRPPRSARRPLIE